MAGEVEIHGHCSAEFEPVRQEFTHNFAERGEVGAACAVVREGKLVVDLWGGYSNEDRTRHWERETVVNLWSTSKGVTAACFAIAVDRGLLSYSDAVATHWPEFGAAGKNEITVAMMLSHQAGLAGFSEPTSLADLYDHDVCASRLATMAPLWGPGTQSGYHAITFGHLANELFRRVAGKTLGEFASDELDDFGYTVGLPPDTEKSVATLISPPDGSSSNVVHDLTAVQLAALANPALEASAAQSMEWRTAEIPSANGFGTARGLAQLYGQLADKGGGLMSGDAIAAATEIQISNVDAVLGVEANWACGFLRNSLAIYGANPRSFGHSGWGGSFAFGDPDLAMGAAYTMNKMGTDLVNDPRAAALVSAAYDCV